MLALEIDTYELREMCRITTTALDSELELLKDAFLQDLSRVGVETLPEDTSLVKACLRLFLRSQLNYNGEADRYDNSYRQLRNGLAQAAEYKAGDQSNGQ